MRPLSIRELAAAAGAAYNGPDRMIPEICTDTRSMTPGCMFVALSGENFDGHDYIEAALEAGAAAVLSMRDSADGGRVLRVRDTRAALLDIAGYYRKLLGLKVVAVTGSVGKTTTKEMAACILEPSRKTLKTPANLNNEIGLSRTILTLEPDHRAAVLEIGVDGPGQMTPLARCAAPDAGIVTAIGVSHLSSFGSRNGILREKLKLRDGMPDGAALILCGDDALLRTVSDSRLRIVFYGIENPACSIRAANIREGEDGLRFDILFGGERQSVFLPSHGRHNVLDALAGFAAGLELDVTPEQAAHALEGFKVQGMRQKMVEHHGILVVEDCYNASPDSMRAALDTLSSLSRGTRRIAVLSDMLELGGIEVEAHLDVGRHAATLGIDKLLCTGPLSAHTVQGAQAAGLRNALHFETQDALFTHLANTARKGDILWFKASRGMRLERLLERVYTEI